ncbi:MAG: pyridoxamine 5'-phosphate oxidase [Weeksellaceae bacterium]|nr:pyridoxamine 5'-phosphate oxidase [Weeksellaceae bacterium]
MQHDLSGLRKNYNKLELVENQVPENPLELFRDWFLQAEQHPHIDEHNAMGIATLGLDGYPKNRMVLLKGYTYEGFIFYTNYESEKGRAIAENPRVGLHFFWPALERQIIIKGLAEKLAENLSDGYFESRPMLSRISASVSPQSQVVPSREWLEEKQSAMEKSTTQEIERPAFWGGYLVRPQSIEFWQGRPNRLHDRLRYAMDEEMDWVLERLAP